MKIIYSLSKLYDDVMMTSLKFIIKTTAKNILMYITPIKVNFYKYQYIGLMPYILPLYLEHFTQLSLHYTPGICLLTDAFCRGRGS